MHKLPKLYLIIVIILFLTPLISAVWYNPFTWFASEEITGTELITKPQGEIVSNANGLNVEWKHLSDQTNPKQTFLLTVTSNSSRTVDPQLILSEYSGNTNNLNVQNLNITYLEKSSSYEYKTKWCSDYTYTDCQYEQTDYYYVNGGWGQVLIETTREVAMPISESQFKRDTGVYDDKTEDILTIDINDMVLETNKPKSYIISLDGIEPKYIGKTRIFSGTFSIMIDGIEYWDKTHSSYWTSTDNCTSSGGTIYLVDDYCIHVFNFNGTFNSSASQNVEVLVVGGGGGGGMGSRGGGGGAGQVYYNSSLSINSGDINIIVGEGGIGSFNIAVRGTNGGNTSFGLIKAIGGGGGGSRTNLTGLDGASGGGGGNGVSGAKGNPGIGLAGYDGGGGSGTSAAYGAGGGGGAGEKGYNGTNLKGGKGGDGLYYAQFNMSGEPAGWFGGGGGGGARSKDLNTTGLGGGGRGGTEGTGANTNATAGTANTGGGGGGSGDGTISSGPGGNGGSGIVIVRYYLEPPSGDTQPPYGYKIQPPYGYNFSKESETNLTIQFRFNASDNSNLKNATLYVWNLTNALDFAPYGYKTNYTLISGIVNDTNISMSFEYNGSYKWDVLLTDNANNKNWVFNSSNNASGNWTFNIDLSGIAKDTSFTVTLPTGTLIAVYQFLNKTHSNLMPINQTSEVPFLNITNTGNVNLNLSLYLNQSLDENITLKAGNTSVVSNAIELNTSSKYIYYGLNPTNSIGIWFWSSITNKQPQTFYRGVNVSVEG